jgi:hypothetical protein
LLINVFHAIIIMSRRGYVCCGCIRMTRSRRQRGKKRSEEMTESADDSLQVF